MFYPEHPAYNDALAQAIRVAARYPIDSKAGARVWYDKDQNTMGVASRDDPSYRNESLETVAYVQRWDKRTIQIRQDGADSTFVPA